jgi:nucleoside 2-deoxyribosyltransferase
MVGTSYDVYLANALFSDADRSFNKYLAESLRNANFTVCLPQESSENKGAAPTARDIFLSDAKMIAKCKLILAVLDGETIDSGVACEVGMAFGSGIPVIGLWTDFRRRREGEGRIYHNIFVLGAITQNGIICSTIDEAIEQCSRILEILRPTARRLAVTAHFSQARDDVNRVLTWIRCAYTPPFDTAQEIVTMLGAAGISPSRVLDVGAGDGRLGDALRNQWSSVDYQPVDPAWYGHGTALADLTYVDRSSVDLAILAFVLHDVPDQEVLMREVARKVIEHGHVLIVDLSNEDLPELTQALRNSFHLGPSSLDNRLSALKIANLCRAGGFEIRELSAVVRPFTFATREKFSEYVAAFGIDGGQDLPWLALASPKNAMHALFEGLTFPFTDTRVFLTCLLRKRSESQ